MNNFLLSRFLVGVDPRIFAELQRIRQLGRLCLIAFTFMDDWQIGRWGILLSFPITTWELLKSVGPITQLLRARASGQNGAESALLNEVYQQLHQLASIALRQERAGHTLSPTALVHEAYLRFSQEASFNPQDRAEFFRLAARRMRQVLVDVARERGAQKRGGELWLRTTFDAQKFDLEQQDGGQLDSLALEQALCALEHIDARKARVVELRYFAGFELQEIADTLEISRKTAQRDWDAARSFLYVSLTKNSS